MGVTLIERTFSLQLDMLAESLSEVNVAKGWGRGRTCSFDGCLNMTWHASAKQNIKCFQLGWRNSVIRNVSAGAQFLDSAGSEILVL